MWKAIVSCALLAACLRDPVFKGKPDSQITVTPGGASVVGINDDFQYGATFGSTGLHLLDSLSIDGESIFGHSSQSQLGCNIEDEAGIALFPSPRISQNSGVMFDPLSVPDVPLGGPAAGQVRVTWRTHYRCTTTPTETMKTVDGQSTYTFFPDGRIVRYESFRQDLPDLVPPPTISECDCTLGQPNNQFFPTVFFSVDAAAFDRVTSEMGGDNAIQTMPLQISPGRYSCAYRDRRQFAVAWPDQMTRVLRRTFGNATNLAFVYDLVSGAGHNTMPATYRYETRATMFLQHEVTGCAETFSRAMASLMPPRLLVNGTALDLASIDGIYGGQQASSMIAGFFVTGDTVTIEPTPASPIPPGFAVWLGWGKPVEPQATRIPADPRGSWYTVQQPTQESAIFWFRSGLEIGEKIEIRI